MKVRDLISTRREVYSLRDDTSVHEAARYLREKQIRSIGIVDAGGRLVGALSQSDISDKVAAENKCPAWMKVSEIMTPELVVVPPDTPLDECIRLMEKNGIFHLLVVDERGVYHGMISVQDLLRVIASDEKARADLFEAMIFPER
jgi:CBS domain-containing protein